MSGRASARVSAGVVGALALCLARPSFAEGPRLGARAGLAGPIGAPQSDDFGLGGGGALSGDLPLTSILSLEGEVGALFLSPASVPAGRPARSLGTISFVTLGPRLHPFGSAPDGPWVGLGAGLVISGSDPRFGGSGSLGWDFAIGEGRWCVGPFASYTHILEPGTAATNESDAHLVWGGAQVTFGKPRFVPPPPAPPPIPDADADGIPDAEDACPNQRGVRTRDDNTNGCPALDSDKDGVPDDEDNCPNLPGERRTDPRMNGCPAVLPKPEPPPEPEKPPEPKTPPTIELD